MQSIANRLRSALARRFLLSIRRASHRMPVQLEAPTRSRVLVVAPHMDDEVIGCGGTLLLHQALRSSVRVVFVSDSSTGASDAAVADRIRAIRRAEMLRVRAALELDSITELGFPDSRLIHHEMPIAQGLAAEIGAFAPTQIFCPFPVDGHADHQACAYALGHATQITGWRGEIMAYEVWSALWPNLAVDIGTVAPQKAALIGLYASQLSDRDYASAILGLNRYRGLQHRIEFAEAFHCSGVEAFRELTQLLDRLS